MLSRWMRAIVIAYPGFATDRETAGSALLAASPMPVADWPELKQEIVGAYDPQQERSE